MSAQPSEKAMAASKKMEEDRCPHCYADEAIGAFDCIRCRGHALDAFAEEARKEALSTLADAQGRAYEAGEDQGTAETERAVEEARREEREAACGDVCVYCAGGTWPQFHATAHFEQGTWWHFHRDGGLPVQCDASAIRSRSSRPPEAGAGGGEGTMSSEWWSGYTVGFLVGWFVAIGAEKLGRWLSRW